MAHIVHNLKGDFQDLCKIKETGKIDIYDTQIIEDEIRLFSFGDPVFVISNKYILNGNVVKIYYERSDYVEIYLSNISIHQK